MKFAGAHGITRSRVPLIAMLALAGAIGLAGCEGDDGKDGAIGPTGPASTVPGPTGPTGPTGPAGQPVVQKPLESCAVCHDSGSVYAVDDAHQVADQGAFADFAVAPDVAVPADLVVSFSATVDGAPVTTATFYRAYTWDGTTRTDLRAEINADLPNLFANNGDGTYSIRIVNGVARFGGANNRYLVILQSGANELEIAAVGDYPAAIPLAGLASNQACIDCHGASGEVGRFDPMDEGGHYSAPMSVDACVVCHRPGASFGDLPYVVHGIHNAHDMPGGKFVTSRDEYETTYPTYMANCSVCHKDDSIVPATGGSALAAANAMPVTGAGCFTCHGAMDNDFWDFTNSSFHLGYDENTNCQTCHSAGNIAPATVAAFHNGIVTERAGIIWNGVDTSVTEGAKFDWQITGIVDNGTNLLISWTAKYNGVDVNPCNAAVGPGAPVFHAAAGGNLSILRSYAQGDDFILGQNPDAPGQANAVNVTTTNTACAGNVATTTIPVDAGITAERGIVALQGKPRVVNINPTATGPMSVRAKTPTREWVVGTGALPTVARRDIVDTGECLKCHVGSLYQHGGNRVDNVDMCIICHNPASSEQNVRVTRMGVDASESYDGKPGQTYEMKTMLHAIHSAGVPGASPIVIYRTRGIYAWATDKSLLPNWATGAACDAPSVPGVDTLGNIVFGSDPASTDKCQQHNFHTPTYPRAINNCAACHGAKDFDLVPDQSKAVATTLDAGKEPWNNQLDDVLQGAGAAACTSCHSTGFARGHAYQNGWNPAVFPNGRQDILDEAN
jgi:OmcA/MtrC family decaheme c-type cytochrome